MKHLQAKAWLSLVLLGVIMVLLVFIPAGTFHYWQGWAFLGVFCFVSFFHTLYALKKDRALLERRMKGGPMAEKRTSQKVIMFFTSACFIALMVVPALDHRYGWSAAPAVVSIVADALIVLGYYIVYLVFRENSFAAATIEVTKDQKVISTGPYALVRHPMYAGSMLYVFAMPLALGSYWGLIVPPIMMLFLVLRLFDEEKALSKDLPGYTGYCAKVRWRLIPRIF